jgi:hypothetical protein
VRSEDVMLCIKVWSILVWPFPFFTGIALCLDFRRKPYAVLYSPGIGEVASGLYLGKRVALRL